MPRLLLPLAPMLCLFVCSGCVSATSTILNRLDSDLMVGSSNGEPAHHCETRPFNGVPITVRVPTHVDVAIREKVRLYVTKKKKLRRVTSRPHLSVNTELVYTDKVFTVDPKRPAAGTLKYTMNFGAKQDDNDNRQYFQNITSSIQDETLQDVTAALSTITSAITTSGDTESSVLNAESSVKTGYMTEYRTVAWRRFDVDALDFEQQVLCFVEQHLNPAESCPAAVYAPGVDAGTLPQQPGNGFPTGESFPAPQGQLELTLPDAVVE